MRKRGLSSMVSVLCSETGRQRSLLYGMSMQRNLAEHISMHMQSIMAHSPSLESENCHASA